MRGSLRYLIATFGILVTAGCSSQVPGTPLSTPPTDSTGTSDTPKVDNPLDATKYEKTPCDLVPGDLIEKLGFLEPGTTKNEGTKGQGIAGPQCGWNGPAEKQGTITVLLETVNRDNNHGGLTNYYDSHRITPKYYNLFEPTKVDGYPALYYDLDDNRSRGDCSLAVGIADNLTFTVAALSYRKEEASRACEDARSLASSVIGTLKGGN